MGRNDAAAAEHECSRASLEQIDKEQEGRVVWEHGNQPSVSVKLTSERHQGRAHRSPGPRSVQIATH